MRSISAKRVATKMLAAGIFLAACASMMTGPRGRARDFSALPDRAAGFPKVILLAWEQRSDLESINPSEVGVAFLAETLYLSGPDIVVRPRLQPLKVPAGTFLMATVRIETSQTRRRLAAPEYSPGQRARAVDAIAALSRLPSVRAVQIDFDAAASERDFYRSLITDVRSRLPDSTALSITALASWCQGDNWLRDLPVDEAVPMLFRMGPDRRQILRGLKDGGQFKAAACNQSLGISTDEPFNWPTRGRRLYVFRPGAWSKDNVRAALGVLPQ